ncbi:MAG: hypothetical protein H6586_00900 [Flavobacteriales bacterium]|nr:hypothetical protein [Flavobacteriales bacterium]
MKKLLFSLLMVFCFVAFSTTKIKAQTTAKEKTETVATDKKCDKECKKECCAKKDKDAKADKTDKKCNKDCKKECCAKKEETERAILEEGVKATDKEEDDE